MPPSLTINDWELIHQALLVYDILLDIFAYVDRKKFLAALAVTCKAFYEPAMDLLWAEIDGLEPLLGCVTRLHPLVYHRSVSAADHSRSFASFVYRLTEHLNRRTSRKRQTSNHYQLTRPVNFCGTPPVFAH